MFTKSTNNQRTERLRQRLTIAESVCKKLKNEFERELSEKLEAHYFIAEQGLREAFTEYQSHTRRSEDGHRHDTDRSEQITSMAEVLGSVAIPSEYLTDGLHHALINAVGDCMDSSDAPMRIRQGDKLLIHQISADNAALLTAVGRVIVFRDWRGRYFTQHLTSVDIACGRLHLSSYNPRRTVAVGLDDLSLLFVVDGVFTNEYIEAHKCI